METRLINDELYKKYTLDAIFRDAVYGELELGSELETYWESEFQISIDVQFGILGVYLGKSYEEHHQQVKEGMENFSTGKLEINRHVVCFPRKKLILVFLFPMIDKSQYKYFQRMVQNEWSLFAPECSVYVGERSKGLCGVSDTVDLMCSNLEWNLSLGGRVLINSERMTTFHVAPLQYSTELDGEVQRAIVHKSSHQFEVCMRKLLDLCRKELHSPDEIKSVCIRFTLAVAHMDKMNGVFHEDLEIEKMMRIIVNAVYWTEIWGAILAFALPKIKTNEQEKKQSILVIQAQRLMLEYYTIGITLEEIADRLHVSEEYLSTIFKKETGRTFSATIRDLRMNKVKELLTTSRLKINEIAKLAGYADAKYMSRVFKEETGMVPNEYRKLRID